VKTSFFLTHRLPLSMDSRVTSSCLPRERSTRQRRESRAGEACPVVARVTRFA
jgi:hypothetical protein